MGRIDHHPEIMEKGKITRKFANYVLYVLYSNLLGSHLFAQRTMSELPPPGLHEA